MELQMVKMYHTSDVRILTEMDMRILMTRVLCNMEAVGSTDLVAPILMVMELVTSETLVLIPQQTALMIGMETDIQI